MVGHTHEDIDQLFSRISSGLAKRDAHTLPQLLEAIETATTPKPVCQHLRSLYDYRDKLLKCKGLVDGIMAPHHFKFEEKNGEVIMSYKDWPNETEEYRAMTITRHVLSLDDVVPVLVNPKINDAITRMEQDLPKWTESGRLENDEIQWWRSYLASCKREARLLPEVPKVTSLGKFRLPAVQEEGELGNLIQAVERNRQKETRRSVLKLKRRWMTCKIF